MPRPSPTNAPVWGMSCSVVAVATMRRSMASGVSPACLIAAAPASTARLAVVSPGSGDPTLTDAGALDDPLVAGVDPLLEVGVGEPLVREGGAPSRDRRPHAQATRSHATGWPSRRRSPRWTSMPDELAAERAAHRRGGAGTVEVADGLAFVDVVARVDVVERAEHAHRGGDDHPLGHEEPFTVGQEGFHGLCDLQDRGMSSGVATLRTVTDGAPRLASAASIEPCPTSRNVVAPRPTSVSIVERQRTGTETWPGRRSRQPSASS